MYIITHIILMCTHIFCYDLWFYISHILLHTKTLRPIHNVHHVNEINLNWTSSFEGHPFEFFFQSWGFFVPFFFRVWDHGFLTECALVISFLTIRGMMRHDERCTFLIGNHHLLHHKYPYCNFGDYYTDMLMGTYKKFPNEEITGFLGR